MTAPLVDTKDFQLGVEAGEDAAVDGPLLAEMEKEARNFLASRVALPPLRDLLLAYALPGVIALYLVQFETPIPSGESEGDFERWVVVGDVPSLHFETEGFEAREAALRFYCAICQVWADSVLAGTRVYEDYPIAVAPTAEHARMLLSRIKFIRHKVVPRAGGKAPSLLKSLIDKIGSIINYLRGD